MSITFLGAAHEVTGSCTLLKICDKNILIDCGMEQGKDIYENCELPISPSDVDVLLLTHAHIDHSGKIPLLCKNGFRGKIYTTEATLRLCRLMLLDSAHIQEFEAEWRNRKALRAGDAPYEPLYTSNDVEKAMTQFCGLSYNTTYKLCRGATMRFIDAGHLLGSASIEITYSDKDGKAKTILFSGDIGNVNRPLIRDPQKPTKGRIVVIESTYGTRLHDRPKDYVSQLSKIISDTLDRGGNVVIPSFAVGRTQELLYLIHEIKSKNLIKNHPDFPVWIDSPLSSEVTKVYTMGMTDYYDSETLEFLDKGINPLSFEGLHFAETAEESRAINFDSTPKVIISSSGMCEAGRIRHHLKHNLWRKDSTVLFVGYQAEGTLGRILLDGVDSVKIFGETIHCAARIENMDGISGHADQRILLDWLRNIDPKPQMVFVNHGNNEVCDQFADIIKTQLGILATAPYNGGVYDLQTLSCIEPGNREKLQKSVRTNDALFERLISAVKQLLKIAENFRHRDNRSKKQFANDVETLCEKWKD